MFDGMEMADRLISLALSDARMPQPIRTLCLWHLKQLDARISPLLEAGEGGQIDAYTLAHLSAMHDRINKAVNSIHVVN